MHPHASLFVMDCGPNMSARTTSCGLADFDICVGRVMTELSRNCLSKRRVVEVGVLAWTQAPFLIHEFAPPTRESVARCRNRLRLRVAEGAGDRLAVALEEIVGHCRNVYSSLHVTILTNRHMGPAFVERLACPDVFLETPEAVLCRRGPLGHSSDFAVFEGTLSLGDGPDAYAIDVAGYPATRQAPVPTPVTTTAPETETPRPYILRYNFGTSLISLPPCTGKMWKMVSDDTKGLSILYFCEPVAPWVKSGPSTYIVGKNGVSVRQLLVFIRALRQRRAVAVARFVPSAGADIEIVVLEPSASPDDAPFLLMSALPFCEDFTPVQFPRLDVGEVLDPEHETIKKLVDELATPESSLPLVCNPSIERLAKYMATTQFRDVRVPENQAPSDLVQDSLGTGNAGML